MSKNPLHIVIQPTYSKERTTFHVTLPLSSSANTLHFFRHNDRTELCTSSKSDTVVEPLALMLADEICRIDGVDSGSEHMGAVDIAKYSICVTYGRAFDENDIELDVLTTIAGVLGVDLDQVTFELDHSMRETRTIDRSSRLTYGA